MPRKKHPNKHIEEALQYAESKDWKIEKSSGHAHSWGKMYCPENSPLCRENLFCIKSIWSTPRNPQQHAREIMRVIDGCVMIEEDDDE